MLFYPEGVVYMVKKEEGQSLLEFALILPLLLLLISGMFDFGRLLYNYMHLHLASQESVRLGGLGQGDAEITAFAQNYIHIGDPLLLEVAIFPSETTRKSGDYINVTLRYPFESITPILSDIIPSPYLIETESTIRVE
jgi:hypothetical protein